MYDVIVIGGRISGASTAMLLARRGHRVLLLEKERVLSETLSTHLIWPRGMSYLNRWGIADDIVAVTPSFRTMELKIEGISLVGRVRREYLEARFEALHGNTHGIIDVYCGPRRRFLDNVLLNGARRAGVEVMMGFDVSRPLVEDGVVVGIEGHDAKGRNHVFRAKLVIGACGRRSRFADQVGAEYEAYRSESTFAYFSYYTGIDQEDLAIHKRGRLGIAIYPTMEDKQMVLAYGPAQWWSTFKTDAESNFLQTLDFCAPEVAELVRKGKRVEKFSACGTMPAFKRRIFGPGWALVGDAASSEDQVTAMGITHSLRDAELISGYIHRALCEELSLTEALTQYVARRAADYDEYFDYACTTAEMNIITEDEFELLRSFQGNQEQIDRLVSVVGDTLPQAEFIADSQVDRGDTIPISTGGWPRGYYARMIKDYDVNFYEQSPSMAANF